MSSRNERVLICHSDQGLGNRIKNLVSCLRIAAEESRRLVLHWPDNDLLACPFDRLFANDIPQLSRAEFDSLQTEAARCRDDEIKIVSTWRLIAKPTDTPRNFARAFLSDCEERNEIDLEYGRIPQAVRAVYADYFRRLVPAAGVQRMLRDHAARSPECAEAVCFRTWQERQGKNRRQIFDPNRLFAIFENAPDTKFFVTGDSQETKNALVKRHKHQIVSYAKKLPHGDRTTPESIQEALVELLIAAQATTIHASYLSTFPEVAWWLGGCEATVSIIEDQRACDAWLKAEAKRRTGTTSDTGTMSGSWRAPWRWVQRTLLKSRTDRS